MDAVDPEEIELVLDFMQRMSNAHHIGIAVGKQSMSRETKSKLERLGLDVPLVSTQQGSIRFCRALASMLYKSTSKLLRLDCIGVQIHPQSYKLLAKGLKNVDSITSINLSSTGLGDAGLAALSGVLSHRPHLNSLNLAGCNLTDGAHRDLASIIRVHGVRKDEKCWTTSLRGREPKVGGDGLQLLNVAHNQLGDGTVEALCEALMHDKWILGLNMSHNLIGPKSFVRFVDLLRINSSLLILKLDHSANADVRLVRFVDNLLVSRQAKIPEAVTSSTSTDERANVQRIMAAWGVNRQLLPSVDDPEEIQFEVDEQDSDDEETKAKKEAEGLSDDAAEGDAEQGSGDENVDEVDEA